MGTCLRRLRPPLVSGPVCIDFWTNKLIDWLIDWYIPAAKKCIFWSRCNHDLWPPRPWNLSSNTNVMNICVIFIEIALLSTQTSRHAKVLTDEGRTAWRTTSIHNAFASYCWRHRHNNAHFFVVDSKVITFSFVFIFFGEVLRFTPVSVSSFSVIRNR